MAPNCSYYSLALRPLLNYYNGPLWRAPYCPYIALPGGLYTSITMDRYGGPQTVLTIALHRGLYLAIIMNPYGVPQTALTIALPGGLYLAITMDRFTGPQTALTIALPAGLYLAITMDRFLQPQKCPNNSLAWRHLFSHYNDPY
jgi:hypothetical protein